MLTSGNAKSYERLLGANEADPVYFNWHSCSYPLCCSGSGLSLEAQSRARRSCIVSPWGLAESTECYPDFTDLSQVTKLAGALTRMLSGSFSNQAQAFENPPLYGNILVRIRPVPHLRAHSLLLEQAYAIAPNEPYRVRVLRPAYLEDGTLSILNFSIESPERFYGAVEEPVRLAELAEADLRLLSGCTYWVDQTSEGFIGKVEPGCNCKVFRKGRDSYLLSEFELTPQTMQTIDRGYDPVTHEHLWGSIAGPFRFEKLCDWSQEVPTSWN